MFPYGTVKTLTLSLVFWGINLDAEIFFFICILRSLIIEVLLFYFQNSDEVIIYLPNTLVNNLFPKGKSMETLSYRFANLEDAEIIHQYTQEVFLESQNFLLLPDYLIDSIKGDELGYLAKIIKDNRSIFYLAFSCSRLVGMSDGRLSKPPSPKLTVGVTVQKNFRRRGIAKKLIEGMVFECRKRNILELNLQTYSHNRAALNLYQSFGFETLYDSNNEVFVTPSGETASKVNMHMLIESNPILRSRGA